VFVGDVSVDVEEDDKDEFVAKLTYVPGNKLW
jgi:hypothetical protein